MVSNEELSFQPILTYELLCLAPLTLSLQAWLAQWGISHWGNRVIVNNWENHDCTRGANGEEGKGERRPGRGGGSRQKGTRV